MLSSIDPHDKGIKINFLLAKKGMLENRINRNSGYKSGNWQVQNNKLSKEFERSSYEIKK